MNIALEKAAFTDCPQLHVMQVAAFQSLLEKYQDFGTSPAAEGVDRIEERFKQPFTTYWFITLDAKRVGALRVCDFGERCRLSPIFILPQYRGKGIAQNAMHLMEQLYPVAKVWELDTIAQEPELRHLYEKMGYKATGKVEHIKDGMDIVFYEKKYVL